MKNFLLQRQWNWKLSGVALATCFFLAVLFVRPIGVSTQFVILDGVIWDTVATDVVVKDPENESGYSSSNNYLNKDGGEYAKDVAKPINYSFIFVISMILGGLSGKILTLPSEEQNKNKKNEKIDDRTSRPYDAFTTKRFLLTFLGGFLVLLGARLAGGCTSGHMMSGMMQTSLSGYLFAMSAFVMAIPTAILLYGKNKED